MTECNFHFDTLSMINIIRTHDFSQKVNQKALTSRFHVFLLVKLNMVSSYQEVDRVHIKFEHKIHSKRKLVFYEFLES